MKICVISNSKNEISNHIEEHFEIPRFQVNDDIQKINKIIKENKEWLIETVFHSSISIIANQATNIIIIKDKEKKSLLRSLRDATKINELTNEEKEFIKKYRNKTILLKNKNEIKKCIEALDNDEKYWF